MKIFNKKGFTLTEVIVVLVIVAVLIAIAVPSVMKYIDDAKDAQIMAKAKGVVQEAELLAVETLAKQEATTWKQFDDIVDKGMQENGYRKGIFGDSPSEQISVSEDWEVVMITYSASGKESNKDSNINYEKNPRITQFVIHLARTINGNYENITFEYIPNESFKVLE
ncbi:MAG: prepilin-type N-terminal cleavage/methylation domain-containing protein [Erysipelotrichia bacterium]|nr:prepilin-type N-terminal cleavage/methylation domain-containing protein [Erysipelotrichia bacterium]NCC54789.1 prepilin-type N-terminal cleavage/methylation domain-containing protein [Erysipelotrichia bacterium]